MSSSKIANLGVDLYKIILNEDGIFDIDIGGTNGIVNINGNLNVTGTTTTVGSSDLVVSDNTITVNNGESGAGVSLGTAGIIVDRGLFSNAEFLYTESADTYINGTIQPSDGAFVFAKADGTIQGIYASSIIAGEGFDLNLLPGQNEGVVSVTGTVDYEKQVFPYTGSNITPNPSNPDNLSPPNDPDIIPNIQAVIDYVKNYHEYNWQDAIKAPIPDGNTQVKVFDTEAGDPTSRADVVIDGTTVAQFFGIQTNIEEIKIEDASIAPLNVNGDLTLQADGTGSVRFPDPLLLIKDTDPTAPVDGIKLYSKAEADGGTGLFFINENGTNDELISRNKALLYSIIF
jgi:hypothetical protein